MIGSDDYIGQKLAEGGLVLRLREIKRPKHSMFRTTTAEGADLGAQLGNVAHRLSTILTSISAWLQIHKAGHTAVVSV